MAKTTLYSRTEILIGAVVLAGGFYLVYTVATFAGFGRREYLLYADFISVSGLHVGDPVEIAGVVVGRVDSIHLAGTQARVGFQMKEGITIEEDSAAKMEVRGLLGDRSILIEPGNSTKILAAGDDIKKTQSPVSFQDLIGQFVAGEIL
jgi:phospholipid/cholesterol/gamma-HCH transport system substrate-binding protein